MTTGHLVTNTNLTLLGDVNLGHLDDACGQLVTDGDGKLLTRHLGIQQFVLLQVIDDQLGNELVGVFLLRPAGKLNGCKVERLEGCGSETLAMRNDLGTHVVLHTLRGDALGQLKQLVDEDGLEVCHLVLELLVDGCQTWLVLSLGRTGLDGTREEFLVDDHTVERRIGLQ